MEIVKCKMGFGILSSLDWHMLLGNFTCIGFIWAKQGLER
jgi:hypothetical protein